MTLESYGTGIISSAGRRWKVFTSDEFAREFQPLDAAVRHEIGALSLVLEQLGPQLGRHSMRQVVCGGLPLL